MAEHDPRAAAYLVTCDDTLPAQVDEALRALLKDSPRAELIERSLCDHGAVVVCPDVDVAIDAVNLIAPEHLEVMMEDPMELFGCDYQCGCDLSWPVVACKCG